MPLSYALSPSSTTSPSLPRIPTLPHCLTLFALSRSFSCSLSFFASSWARTRPWETHATCEPLAAPGSAGRVADCIRLRYAPSRPHTVCVSSVPSSTACSFAVGTRSRTQAERCAKAQERGAFAQTVALDRGWDLPRRFVTCGWMSRVDSSAPGTTTASIRTGTTFQAHRQRASRGSHTGGTCF